MCSIDMNSKTKSYPVCIGCWKKLAKKDDYVRPEPMEVDGRLVKGRACDWCYKQRHLKTVAEILGSIREI